MKIFGIEISLSKKESINIRPIRISSINDVEKAKNLSIAKIPNIQSKVFSYSQQQQYGRTTWNGPEYDLNEIGKIEDTESFVRQSFKKKIGLMFKEGYGYKSSDKDALSYIKIRLFQIAQASNIPELELMKRVGYSLIRTSNAFILKVRDEKASGGKTRKSPKGKKLNPIAAYFPIAPETMKANIDQKTGKILSWMQMLPDGKYQEFSPEDIIHFCIDRREGFLFGVPSIIPVIDDIRAFRQIEENIELLLYQNLFPLFHYKVGTETAPAGYTEAGEKEIDLVKEQIQIMPSEGAIVTPERHEITAIGSEGRAIHAEGYLDHFKKRVIAGLGISQIDLGDGDTTNRATANTLSRALVDAVKDIQDSLEAQWNHEVIKELLLESTFDEELISKQDLVKLQFHEIDLINKLDAEKHAVELFKQNAITWDELRAELNREPIQIPEDPNDQDPKKYPEWFKTYWKLFEEPLNLIRAVDEPYSAKAQALAQAHGSALTQKGLEQEKEGRAKEAEAEAEMDKKTKLAVAKQKTKAKKDAATLSLMDNLILDTFNELREDIISKIKNKNDISKEYITGISKMWEDYSKQKLIPFLVSELVKGFNEESREESHNGFVLINKARKEINDRINNIIKRIATQLSQQLTNNIEINKDNDIININEIQSIFDSILYRIDYMWMIETKKSYNYGKLLGMRFSGHKSFKYIVQEDCCKKCETFRDKQQFFNNIDLDDVPPLHPHSRMDFEAIKE